MPSSKYDFEGLWFATFQRVQRLNNSLGETRLDDSQLREVTTSIFIAKTQRGIVKPQTLNSFQQSVVNLLEPVNDRDVQKRIYTTVQSLATNGKQQKGDSR